MERFKTNLLDETAVTRALKRIAHEILEHNSGADGLVIVGIKRRGIPLAALIANNIEAIEGKRVPMGALDITFYRDDLQKSALNPIVHPAPLGAEIEGRHVILVDDVLYTGRTAAAALDALKDFGRAASVQLAVLVDRGHRELPIRGDYVGKNIPTSRLERVAVKIPPYDDRIAVDLYENAD